MAPAAVASIDNKQLARRVLEEVYSHARLDLIDLLVHPEFVDHEPGHLDGATGAESVRQTVQRLHSVFGDLRFRVDDEIAEGDKVVQRVTMSGRHTGALMGRKPTDKAFTARHVYIWRIADGRIVEHWGVRDDLGLLQQLELLSLG